MQMLGKREFWSYYQNQKSANAVSDVAEVRRGPGHYVKSLYDLVQKVAELQFRNPDLVMMFRGQVKDYRSKNNDLSTLEPSLFRLAPTQTGKPTDAIISGRYAKLAKAEKDFVEEYEKKKFLGLERLKRYRLLRWAILQHYEVCPTPLLDVTPSLRIAASFASIGLCKESYLYVFGVPNLSGAVTACADAGIQIIRLSSICPPTAVRPHIQEGYLLGEYPDLLDFDQNQLYGNFEFDFGRRLLAKFKFNPGTFWQDGPYSRIVEDGLFPNEKDPLFKLTEPIRTLMKSI